MVLPKDTDKVFAHPDGLRGFLCFRAIFSKNPEHHLVGGLEHECYFSHHIGNVIIPTDFHIFQRGCFATNQRLRNDLLLQGWRMS